MAAEAVRIDGRSNVDSGAAREQPARDLDRVVFDGHVQQRPAGDRRAVERQRFVFVTAQLQRIDFAMREGAAQKLPIAGEMRFEQIDAAAVQGHRRGVWQRDALSGQQLQALVLALGIT